MKLIKWRLLSGTLGLAALFWLFQFGRSGLDATGRSYLTAQNSPDPGKAFVSPLIKPGISAPVRDLPVPDFDPLVNRELNPRHNPLKFEPDLGRRGTWSPDARLRDPLAAGSVLTGTVSPAPRLSFDGSTGCAGCSPPDVVGDVGPNHYVSMVNVHFSIFDKQGNLLAGPAGINQLFAGSPGRCALQNEGDPIPVYDPMADRWLLSQFANPNHLCVAVSQTADPAGAYFTYEFDTGEFPDYFKFAAWPSGYFMSANESSYTAYAFDRARMLAGEPARFVKFGGGANFYLPSDVDGTLAPPPDMPNYFYTFKDNAFHGGSDRLELWRFSANWDNPSGSSFILSQSLPIASFQYTPCGFFQLNCIRQKGTSQRLDALGEWPMFRFPYRRFDGKEALVGAFAVGGGRGEVGSAIRWFELRRQTGSTWSLIQEGTLDPGDGHDRFNPSIAIDRIGGLALGYSVSSSTLFPEVRYVVRQPTDPPGTMRGERTLIASQGAQTGSNRWGDYSAMTVDPTDECSFWYTNQYYPQSAPVGWKTRVGVFAMPACLTPDFQLVVEPQAGSFCSTGPAAFDITLTPQNGFSGVVNLSTSGLPTAAGAEFAPASVDLAGRAATSRLTLVNMPVGETFFTITAAAQGQPSLTHSFAASLANDLPLTEAPNGLQPVDWAVQSSQPVRFSWQLAGGAAGYRLDIATDPDFQAVVATAQGIKGTSYELSSPLPDNGLYYWRVNGRNGCGDGPRSETGTFRTAPGPGQCPIGRSPKIIYFESFDGSAPGWRHDGEQDSWQLKNGIGRSGTAAFQAAAPGYRSRQRLLSPTIQLPEFKVPITLQFWQTHQLEASLNAGVCWDGALVELSSSGGTSWEPADSTLVSPAFDGVINGGYGNPLGGRSAWCGERPEWSLTVASLDRFAGQAVDMAFLLGTDASIGGSGWAVDDVTIQVCEAQYDLRLVAENPLLEAEAGQPAAGVFTLHNAGTMPDSYILEVTSEWPVAINKNRVSDLAPGGQSLHDLEVQLPDEVPSGSSRPVTITARSEALPFITSSAVFTVTARPRTVTTYLPYVPFKDASGPDLVVRRVEITPHVVEIVIANQGGQAVDTPFWVDLYLNPPRPPARVNETIDRIQSHGIVWGIDDADLPLPPGGQLTLHLSSPSLVKSFSRYSLPLVAGSVVYVQVDSAAAGSGFGAVLEIHENIETAYNNIAGPVLVTGRLPDS